MRQKTVYISTLLSLLITVLVSLSLAACNRQSEVGLHPGDTAPDFKLQDLNGVEHSLAEYRGKVLLLNFWTSWCVPCVAEMPALERLRSLLKNEGLEVLAIGVDDGVQALQEFQSAHKISFPILIDATRSAAKSYGVAGFPESFFIGRNGEILIVPDPATLEPLVRIIGPREWDSAGSIALLRGLLN